MIDVRLAGRYRLEAEVGAGGMTTVWQAVDEVLERRVAVKILHRHLLSNEVFCARFRQESLAAGPLTHPNIAAVYDSGQYDDAPYVVMEYLGGGSLEDALGRDGSLPPARVAAIGADVCEALACAHRAGVVHRDLKPSNVVFSDAGPLLGQVKVTDFAVAAAALGGDLTATGALLGTLSFLAPEVLDGGEPRPSADLYALGVLLFKALTGRSPRAAGNDLTGANRPRTQPAHPRDFRPSVPRDLDEIVARALAESPAERFSDAAEMGRLLRAAAQARSVRAVEPAPAPVPARPAGPRAAPAPGTDDTASFVRTEGRWLAPVVLLVLTAVAIVLGVLQLSGKLPALTGGGSAPAAAPLGASQTLPLKVGGVLQVSGQAAGATGDHPEAASMAFDGNPSTSWKTQAYRGQPDFGGLQPGVGIYGDLGQPMTVSRIQVDSPTPGWQGSIRYSDDAVRWSVAESGVTASATQTFNVSADGSHRYWMVWITQLPPVPGGPGQFQALISEIKAFR